MYFTQVDTIYRIAPTTGGCTFLASGALARLVLSPATASAQQGGTQSLTATFQNVSVPAGTGVTFVITGSNPALKDASTDASGHASITLTGYHAGVDSVFAAASAGNSSYSSNDAVVTWSSGKHVSSLSLNSPQGGTANALATLRAGLQDVSLDPSGPIGGAVVHLVAGPWSCNATTDAHGMASCTITPTAPGTYTLTATYPGNASFTAGTISRAFTVLGSAASATAPGSPTGVIGSPGNLAATLTFTAPASDGGSAITSYVASCTPIGGGAPITASGASSPITLRGLSGGVSYTCTVSAINSVGASAPSAPSNVVTPLALRSATEAIPTLHEWAIVALASLLLVLALASLRGEAGLRRPRGGPDDA